MQDSLILREHLDLQYVLLGNDFMKINSISISYFPDSESVSINDQKVKMLEPSSPSNKVDIFSATLKKLSHHCKNVTRNLPVKDLSDVPEISHPETSSEIPPDFSQPGSPLTTSDYLFDKDLKPEIQQFLIFVLKLIIRILQ